MLVKLATNFPKDGQRIAIIGTSKIVKPVYSIFALGFRPKKQQFSVALATP